jgi:hypothetical protein
MNPGDKVSVIYDETTADTAKILINAGEQLGLSVSELFVPLTHQREFSPDRGLCRHCLRALRGYAGILTCVSDHSDTTSYRRELLREAASGRTRVGHMPGARRFVLEWAVDVDYGAATARCQDLAFALAVGTSATVETSMFDDGGTETARYSLHLDLGGLSRLPIVSTGVIPSGAWGNVPGGETYIAPLEGRASGIIAINGAFKNKPLSAGQALVFHFEDGRMTNVDGPADCIKAFNKLVEKAMATRDPQWNQLAELGIGVNPGIPRLTGNSLFDEKCAGTIHIAIGENQDFGGSSDSSIHEDLVARRPSLWVDHRAILLDGENAFVPSDWYEELDTYPVDGVLSDGDPYIARTPESISNDTGCLFRVHQVAAGKTCVYRVGNESTSPLLLRIIELLKPLGRIPFSRWSLEATLCAHLTERQLKAGLSILARHGLVVLAVR